LEPVWHILADGEFQLVLANAAHVKNVPGRNTDVSDAEWLADLLVRGLILWASDRGRSAISSNTSIDLRQERSCEALISPR
jgi:hypothetical protein